MRFGCWRRGGRRRWDEPWSGMPIRLVNGPKPSLRAVPKGWFLSRLVVPPRVGRGATSRVEGGGEQLPSQGGIKQPNWNWKAVRRYVEDRFGLALSRSLPVADLNYLHRLGFVLKRPKKRLLKADPARREDFVGEYAALTVAAAQTGTKIFFADEAHFQADADLRGKWVLKGEPALVDSTSPRRGEKVSYYSAVCLETGEVEVMELEGNSNSVTSSAFLGSASGGRERHAEPLIVIWDNAPAHRGDALRAYLTTPDLKLRLVNPVSSTGQALPSYRPDFNAPIFDQSRHLGLGTPGSNRQPVPGNPCRGTGKGGRLFHRSDPPTGGSQTPLPNRAASKSRRINWRHPSQPSPPCKCSFHPGFGLVLVQSSIESIRGFVVEASMLAAISGCVEVQQPWAEYDIPSS